MGSFLRVRAGDGPSPGFEVKVSYSSGPTTRKEATVNRAVGSNSVFGLTATYPEDYLARVDGTPPSPQYLASNVTIQWSIRDWPPGSPYTQLGTGNIIEVPLADPFPYGGALYIISATYTDELGGVAMRGANNVGPSDTPHMRGGPLILQATGAPGFLRTVALAGGYFNAMFYLRACTVDTNGYEIVKGEKAFDAHTSACAWQDATGRIWCACTKTDLPYSNLRYGCDLWMSPDMLRSISKVASIWSNSYRNAVTVPIGNAIVPGAACSAAIKRGTVPTDPSQVWFKISRDGVTWDENDSDKRCEMFYVGDLPTSAKEPLSIMVQGGVFKISNGDATRLWESHNGGREWSL